MSNQLNQLDVRSNQMLNIQQQYLLQQEGDEDGLGDGDREEDGLSLIHI